MRSDQLCVEYRLSVGRISHLLINSSKQKPKYRKARSESIDKLSCIRKLGLEKYIQSNLYTTATLGTEECGRCREIGVMER